MECTCWVADETEEVRFGIRYGAHCEDCPQYRKSRDPVDLANDIELREANCTRPDHTLHGRTLGFSATQHR